MIGITNEHGRLHNLRGTGSTLIGSRSFTEDCAKVTAHLWPFAKSDNTVSPSVLANVQASTRVCYWHIMANREGELVTLHSGFKGLIKYLTGGRCRCVAGAC